MPKGSRRNSGDRGHRGTEGSLLLLLTLWSEQSQESPKPHMVSQLPALLPPSNKVAMSNVLPKVCKLCHFSGHSRCHGSQAHALAPGQSPFFLGCLVNKLNSTPWDLDLGRALPLPSLYLAGSFFPPGAVSVSQQRLPDHPWTAASELHLYLTSSHFNCLPNTYVRGNKCFCMKADGHCCTFSA